MSFSNFQRPSVEGLNKVKFHRIKITNFDYQTLTWKGELTLTGLTQMVQSLAPKKPFNFETLLLESITDSNDSLLTSHQYNTIEFIDKKPYLHQELFKLVNPEENPINMDVRIFPPSDSKDDATLTFYPVGGSMAQLPIMSVDSNSPHRGNMRKLSGKFDDNFSMASNQTPNFNRGDSRRNTNGHNSNFVNTPSIYSEDFKQCMDTKNSKKISQFDTKGNFKESKKRKIKYIPIFQKDFKLINNLPKDQFYVVMTVTDICQVYELLGELENIEEQVPIFFEIIGSNSVSEVNFFNNNTSIRYFRAQNLQKCDELKKYWSQEFPPSERKLNEKSGFGPFQDIIDELVDEGLLKKCTVSSLRDLYKTQRYLLSYTLSLWPKKVKNKKAFM